MSATNSKRDDATDAGTLRRAEELEVGSEVKATVIRIYGEYVLVSLDGGEKAITPLGAFNGPPSNAEQFDAVVIDGATDDSWLVTTKDSGDRDHILFFFMGNFVEFAFKIEQERGSAKGTPYAQTTPRFLMRSIMGSRRTRGNVSHANTLLLSLIHI